MTATRRVAVTRPICESHASRTDASCGGVRETCSSSRAEQSTSAAGNLLADKEQGGLDRRSASTGAFLRRHCASLGSGADGPASRGYGGALVPPQAEGRRATRVWRRGGPRCRRRPALPLCRRGYSGAVRRDRDVRIAPAFRNTCEHPMCDAYRPICAEGWLRVPAAAGMRWWIDLCDDFQPTPDGINRRARRARRDPY
jgi:hypothetical protein